MDPELLIAKFRLKLKKVGETTRPFKYDLNQVLYDYTEEVRNRLKGLGLIDRLMNYGHKFLTLYRRHGSRTSPPCPPPGDLPNPWIKPRSPTLQVNSLPSEPPGKPENTEVGSLSLLQGIFPTQESNQGFLHCRQILYQLSYQRSPLCDLSGLLNLSVPLSLHLYSGDNNSTFFRGKRV